MSASPTMPPLHHRQAVDDVLEAYLEWREESTAVWDAYRRWTSATAEHKVPAHAAYQAALDREEAAANVYAMIVDRVSQLLGQTGQTATPTQQRRHA
jgi:hypothetical protein